MSSINFDNVWLLLIAVPVLVLLTVPFLFAVNKDNRNWHNITSCVLHVFIALLVGFSAAGTTVETVMTETDVYVVADVSYSTQENLDLIDGHIARLGKNLPRNSKLGVVCFGKDYTVLTPLGGEVKSVKEAQVDGTETNVVPALNYVGRLFKNDVIKRVVLITDAKQSNGRDTNDLRQAVQSLNDEKVFVDAIYINSNLAKEAREVQISAVEASQTVYKNQEAQAEVSIQSSFSTQVSLTLTRFAGEDAEGELLLEEPIALNLGVTSYYLDLPTDETGEYSYEVAVQSEEDGSPFNNSSRFSQTVASVVNALVITDVQSDADAAVEYLGENATADCYVSDPDVPYTVAQLCEYDEIILSNVDVSQLNNYKMFVDSLYTAVNLLGKSLFAFGNLNLDNATDPYMQKLAGMLPVRYGNTLREGKMYVIVFDVSLSMVNYGKTKDAKEAAYAIVDLLDEKDKLGIVSFDGMSHQTMQPRLVSDKQEFKDKIEALNLAHGTVMSAGLNTAYDWMIEEDEYSNQHVFLIGDGLNSAGDDRAALLAKVAEMKALGIATSAFHLYGNANDDSNAAYDAEQLLTEMSQKKGGGYYWAWPNDEEIVPPELIREFGETQVTRMLAVDVAKRYDGVLEGVFDANTSADVVRPMSWINTFLRSSDEASATTVLTVEHDEVTYPLYSYWNCGNGRAAAFTSSLSNKRGENPVNWMGGWESWEKTEAFFQNLFESNVPDERNHQPFTLSLREQTGAIALEITPAEVKDGAEVTVTVVNPAGEQSTLSNLLLESSVYECEILTPSVGEYQIQATYSYKGNAYVYARSYFLSFLPEYDEFTGYDAAPLYQTVGLNGTVSEDGSLTIEVDESKVEMRIVSLSEPFLIACVSLFAVDIIIRKLKWEDIVSLFKHVTKEGK